MSREVIDSRVAVPGGSLFVRRWSVGHEERPPILLLHDSLGSVEQWRDFPAALAAAAASDVVAYDRLGFGRSTARLGRPTVDFVRDEAVTSFPALRSALGLTRFCVFGHSVGGAMALIIAALSPGACTAVVTEAAQACVEPRTLAGIRAARLQFRAPEQFRKLVKWHGEKAGWVLDAWTEVWLSAEFAAWNLDEYLRMITCPVLAIHGGRDEFGSVEFPRRITRQVRGPAEQAIWEDCGHVPHREKQDEVLRVTAGFLTRWACA
ncbi:MAG: alpha/beta hydrolase [Proteobacteria bacterium]|nr:alpha/beta hydrolase [Pseudomonadota bacterium]